MGAENCCNLKYLSIVPKCKWSNFKWRICSRLPLKKIR